MSGEDPFVSQKAMLRSGQKPWPRHGNALTGAIERAIWHGDAELARKLIEMRERAASHDTEHEKPDAAP